MSMRVHSPMQISSEVDRSLLLAWCSLHASRLMRSVHSSGRQKSLTDVCGFSVDDTYILSTFQQTRLCKRGHMTPDAKNHIFNVITRANSHLVT